MDLAGARTVVDVLATRARAEPDTVWFELFDEPVSRGARRTGGHRRRGADPGARRAGAAWHAGADMGAVRRRGDGVSPVHVRLDRTAQGGRSAPPEPAGEHP